MQTWQGAKYWQKRYTKLQDPYRFPLSFVSTFNVKALNWLTEKITTWWVVNLTGTMYYIKAVLLFTVASSHVEAFVEQKLKLLPGFRSNNTAIKSASARSRINCGEWCITASLCLGFNYRFSDRQCDLLSTPHGKTKPDGWTFGCKLHLEIGETKNCRRRYTKT